MLWIPGPTHVRPEILEECARPAIGHRSAAMRELIARLDPGLEHAFGLELQSIPWERMEGFSAWAMAFMAADGNTIDFSDSWAKRGWGTFMPLLAHMVDTENGGVTAEPDPCFAHRFFSNKYYYHGLADPWNVHPALARDWPSIIGACDATDGMVPDGIELRAWSRHVPWLSPLVPC